MAILPSMDVDPTLEAMHEIMEAEEAAKERRGYLGASSLGNACERQVWYQYHGYPHEPMKRQGIYATQDGHLTEEVTASRLRKVPGIELATVDDAGDQFGFSRFDGKLKGHIDGFIRGLLQAPKTPHIWENKSCNEKKFANLKKMIDDFGQDNALKEWDYTFYVQAQMYMGEFELDRHYMTVNTPGAREYISVRTKFDREVYKSMLSKAERIITVPDVPERAFSSKLYWNGKHGCKYCKFAEECWKEK